MSTIFSKIISGEIPAHKVAESNDYLAFLDISPLAEGHVLIVPKKEIDYIFDIGDADYMGIWMFAKIVAAGIKAAFPCEKVGVAVIGLEVPHAHIHLVPINHVGDINFSKDKLKLSDEQLSVHAEKIRHELAKLTNNE